MKRVLLLLITLIVGVACASAGQTSDDTSRVPVFRSADEVQCEYEVLQIVRVRRTVDRTFPFDGREIYRGLRLKLGQAGGAVGADAVISPDPFSGPGTVGATRAGDPGDPLTFRLQGQAIKCIQMP